MSTTRSRGWACLALVLGASSGAAWGGAFAIPEQSASGTGTAFAGAAASAEDASTIYYNPAGMTFLPRIDVLNGLSIVSPTTQFANHASVPAVGQPVGNANPGIGQLGYVPFVYVSAPVAKDWWLGIGVNAPFGLATEYPDDWVGRFQGTKSETQGPTINPALAWRVSPTLALGVGFDAQRFYADLDNAVNYTAIVAQAAKQLGLALPLIPGLAGSAEVKGHDWGYGWNVGAIWSPTPETRLGLSYRSAISYTLEGNVSFDRPTAPTTYPPAVQAAVNQIINAATPDGPVSVALKVPPLAMLSGTADVAPDLTLMADVTWTGWSTLQSVDIVRSSGQLLSSQPYGYTDTWRYSLGGRYRFSERWALRAGVAYDQTPVPEALRTVRLPDANKTWFAAGVQWRPAGPTGQWYVDVGYAYVSAAPVTTHSDQTATGAGIVDGAYRSSIQLLSAQFGALFN